MTNLRARLGKSVLIAASLMAAASGLQARTLDAVKSGGALRVTVYNDYKPWSWKEDGVAKGIDVDLAAALAKKLGVKVDYLFLRADDDINDDLRNGVWRGSLVGEAPGDVMLHVPHDAKIEADNDKVKLTAAYQVEGLAMAVEPDKAERAKDISLFETEKVAVDLGTLSDFILLSVRDHKLIDRVVHVRGEQKAVQAFDRGEVVAFYGESAMVESLSHELRKPVSIIFPEHKLARNWPVGGAVKADSIELADAIDAATASMAASGELQKIFAAYGVNWRQPPQEK